MIKTFSYKYIFLTIQILLVGCQTDHSNQICTDYVNFTSIAPGIYLFKDICNVYVLKSGDSVLLIDAGSGKINEHLNEIGVEKINWVLHTHYHRDQTLGSAQLKSEGVNIALNEQENQLIQRTKLAAPFEVPEEFLLNGELPGWGRRMAPFHRIDADKTLKGGDVINWNNFEIKVLETPGHTKGSVSYLVESGDKKLCFTGDLILKGGHIRNLYSMQWVYLRNPGIDASIKSIETIKKLNPDLLLPSHGEIIFNPLEDIEKLDTRLNKFRESFNLRRMGRWNWSQFVQVSEHVIQDGGSTSQIVISASGKALLFDCGKEFSPQRLKEAKDKFGIKKVDVIIPSHWHYDHVDGINEIVKSEGAKVWIWKGLAEYLEKPENFPTTCWTGKTIKVDRILKEKEEFEWEGYSFKVYHNPAHTEQQMGLYANVDGIDFYFIGDGTGYSREGIRSSIHCYNGLELSSGLLKTTRSVSEANPYIILAAHSNVFALIGGDTDEYINWVQNTTNAIKDLLPDNNKDLAYDPYWATFYPTRIHANPGDETEMFIRLKNYGKDEIFGKCWLKAYGDITFNNEIVEYKLNPGEIKDFPVQIKINQSAGKGIHIVTADVEYGGEVFAEFPQAYIEINE